MLGRTVNALGVPLLYERVGAKMRGFWGVTALAILLSGVALASILTPIDPFALAGIAAFAVLTAALYLAYGRKHNPGSVFVNEKGEFRSWKENGNDDINS